jgi:hypothetical protein
MEESDLKHQSENLESPGYLRKRIRNMKWTLVIFVLSTITLALFVLSIVYFKPLNQVHPGFTDRDSSADKEAGPGTGGYLPNDNDRHVGIYYEVQIGAFKDFNLEKYNQNLINLKMEKEGGVFKYSLGRFREYREAMFFENDLKRMGFSDAFIIAKEDGIRVDLDSLLRAEGF